MLKRKFRRFLAAVLSAAMIMSQLPTGIVLAAETDGAKRDVADVAVELETAVEETETDGAERDVADAVVEEEAERATEETEDESASFEEEAQTQDEEVRDGEDILEEETEEAQDEETESEISKKEAANVVYYTIDADGIICREIGTDKMVGQTEYDNQSSSDDAEVQIMTNLSWSKDTPGTICFYNPNEETVGYVVNLYKNDTNTASTWGSVSSVGDVTINISYYINDAATYKFIIKTFAYGEEKSADFSEGDDNVSGWSEEYAYTRPSTQIATPSNITWSDDGVASWDAVEHAFTYGAYLYQKADSGDASYTTIGQFLDSATYRDFSSFMATGYQYYVRVRAYSENIEEYANGDLSEDYVAFTSTVDKVNETLQSLLDESDDILSIVNAVKDAFSDSDSKDELRIAMQTDEETQELIAGLEEEYQETKGVSVDIGSTGGTGIDADSVSLLGAALNATESGTVTFNASEPDEDTLKNIITNTWYTEAIVVDFVLEGAGITKGECRFVNHVLH